MSVFEKLEARILLSADLLPLPAESSGETQVLDHAVPVPAPDPGEPVAAEISAEPTAPATTEPSEQVTEQAEAMETAPLPVEDEQTAEPEPVPPEAAEGELTEEAEEEGEPAPVSLSTEMETSEVIFVNDDIEGSEPLLTDLQEQSAGSQIFVLDSSVDGIDQVTTILEGFDNLDSVQFFSHGTEGNVKLGDTWLNKTSLSEYSTQVSSWADALHNGSDILFYGCDVAATAEGQEFLDTIAELTDADVAASTDTTGHSDHGGDWILEYKLGQIETALPLSSQLQDNWQHILAEETVADNFNTVAYNNSTGTTAWASDWAETDEATDPSSGNIYINNNKLYITSADEEDPLRAISRKVNLSSATSAYIIFDYERIELEGGGRVTLEARAAGDPSWHTITSWRINVSNSGSEILDISPYLSAATEIRFSTEGKDNAGSSDGVDRFTVDNLRIDYTTTSWNTPLWLTTESTVSDGEQPGIEDWKKADVLGFGDPLLSFGKNSTSGTVSMAAQMSSFAGGHQLNALHYVSNDMEIGSFGYQLKAGDLLFVSSDSGSSDFGAVDPDKDDIVLFHPTTAGNYTSGSFTILFDDLIGGTEIRGISLIESDVTVGGKDLFKGDLLFLRSGGSEEHNIYLYETNDVAPGSGTSGTVSLLLDGSDTGVDIRERLTGIDLVEQTVTYGSTTLDSGTILLSVHSSDTIGSTLVQKNDIFALNVTSVSDPTFATDIGVATASIFFDGSNVDFNRDSERLDGFTLTTPMIQPESTFTEGTFTAGSETLTLSGTNFTFMGNSGSDIKDYMDWSKFVWDINGDNGVTADITFASTDFDSVIVTNSTTLTLNLTSAKASAIITTPGYGGAGGADTLDITTGFSGNAGGSYSTVDGLDNGTLTTITTPTDIALSVSTINENTNTSGGHTIGVLSATDADFNDTATFTIVGGADSSLFSIFGSNELRLDDGILDFEQQSSYQVTVRVTDLSGLTYDETLTVTVNNVNDIPVLGNNSLTISEGGYLILTSANLSATDQDDANSGLTFTVSSVSGGWFAENSAPLVAIPSFLQSQIAAGTLRFVHDGNETAPAYQITVSDGTLTTAPAAGTITFTNVNDIPQLTTNQLTINEGATVALSTDNFQTSDPDNLPTELTFTASNVSGGRFQLASAPGTAIFTFTQQQIIDYDIEFVHNGGESAPAFDISVDDGEDNTAPAAATITYTPVNDIPVLQNNALTISQGGTVILSSSNLLTNDPDDAPGALTYTVSNVNGGVFWFSGFPPFFIPFPVASFTQAQVNAGQISFVHSGLPIAPSYDVTVQDDEFASDGPEAAVIAFNTVNQAPVLGSNALTISEGGSVTLAAGNLSATDVDNNDATLIFNVSVWSGGQFELSTNPGVEITSFNQANITAGQVVFVHNGGEATAAYDITVTDGDLSDGPAAAAVTFTNVNDAPTLGNNALTISEGGTVIFGTGNLTATDVDTDDATLIFTVSDVIGGKFTTIGDPVTAITTFTQAQISASQIQYIHNGNEAAAAYKVRVGDGSLTTAPAQATINYTNLNDAPVLGNNSLTLSEGEEITLSSLDLSATDVDSIEGNLTFTVSSVSGGTFERLSLPGTPISFFDQSELLSGDIIFIHDGNEAAPSYQVSVSDGSLATAPADAAITFTNINDQPTLVNNSMSINEGQRLVFSSSELSAYDPDSTAFVYSVTSLSGGYFDLTTNPTVAITSFTQALLDASQVRFVHDDGDAAPVYSITVSDGSLTDGPAAATVTFTNVNDAPVVSNLSLSESYTEDIAKKIGDIVISDGDGGTLYTVTFTLSDTAAGTFNTATVDTARSEFAGGTLTVTGTGLVDVNSLLRGVTFTPATNYNSNFTIATSATDGIAAPQVGVRTFTAVAVNDPPTASNINYSDPYTEDTDYALRVINVADVDSGEIITATLTLANPLAGTLSTTTGGTYTSATGVWQFTDTVANINTALASVNFLPATDFDQNTQIDVQIEDGLEDGVSELSGTIHLTAVPVGDTPQVSDIATDGGVTSAAIVISPNASDGPEVTHFRIVNITGGNLFKLDGITAINNNDFITRAEGAAGVRFLPSSGAGGSFGVLSSENGTSAAAQSGIAVSTISINAPPATAPVIVPPVIPPVIEPIENGATAGAGGPEDSGEATKEIPAPATPIAETVVEVAAGQLEPPVITPEPIEAAPAEEDQQTEETVSEKPPAPEIQPVPLVSAGTSAPSSAPILPQTQEAISINLAFRNIGSTVISAASPIEVAAENVFLVPTEKSSPTLKAADYSLLDLNFRQRSTEEYDYIKNSLDTFREETTKEGAVGKTVIGSAIATSTGLSAGYVIWLLRSGALLSSILSSLPAWQLTDPLAILAGRRRDDEEGDDDDSLESIVASGQQHNDKTDNNKPVT